jgi:hypothetical protein
MCAICSSGAPSPGSALLPQRQQFGLQSEVSSGCLGSSLASRFAKRAARNLSSELRMPVA